jgi:hypothetical protein
MESTRLKKMMKRIEDAMAAVSFAEEGDFETAESLFNRERRVLLALKEGRTDAKTLKYALNTALRIKAHLDILSVSSTTGRDRGGDPGLQQFESDLKAAGVPYRMIQGAGCLKQEIVDYTDREHEVLFVVIESPASLDTDCKKKDTQLAELWQKLRCPLVVVMDEAKA